MHIIIIIIIAVTALIFVRATNLGYPKTDFKQNRKRVFLILLISLAYLGVATLIIVLVFDQPIQNAPDIALGILWGIGFPALLIGWIRSSQTAGKVLLDVGSIPNSYAYLILAAIFVLIGFVGDFFDFLVAPYPRYISILLGISIAICSLVLATSRLQICENGFLVYRHLLKWEKIESFSWHRSKKAYFLKLKFNSFISAFTWMNTLPIIIPLEKKGRLDSILELHLSNKISTAKTPNS